VADNFTVEGRSKNRAVDIIPTIPVRLPSVCELFPALCRLPSICQMFPALCRKDCRKCEPPELCRDPKLCDLLPSLCDDDGLPSCLEHPVICVCLLALDCPLECGSRRLPLTRVSFFPGPLGQGGRVKASRLTTGSQDVREIPMVRSRTRTSMRNSLNASGRPDRAEGGYAHIFSTARQPGLVPAISTVRAMTCAISSSRMGDLAV
jgi:hypothetical protein